MRDDVHLIDFLEDTFRDTIGRPDDDLVYILSIKILSSSLYFNEYFKKEG